MTSIRTHIVRHSLDATPCIDWAAQAAAGLDFITVGAPASGDLLTEVAHAQALGYAVKVTLTGPLSALWASEDAQTGADVLLRLDTLAMHYCALLAQLHAQGVHWVQIDEPILGLTLPPAWRDAFGPCYWQLGQSGARLMLAVDAPLKENLGLACRLPVAGLHVDGVAGRSELVSVCDWLPVPKVLSVAMGGELDLDDAISDLAPLLERRRGALWLAPTGALGELAPLKTALEASLAFA